jgi:hypothetical protein
VAAGVVLAKFGKVALLLLTKAKFLTTSGSMLVSIAAYSLIWGWKFAAGFVALLFVHEMGHYIQMRREGVQPSWMVFIPFMGAAVGARSLGGSAVAEARVGLAGPILGTLGTLVVAGIYWATGEDFWRALAFVGFFLNLFNLLPVLPLDGGPRDGRDGAVDVDRRLRRAADAADRRPNPILIIILLFGGMETWRRYKQRKSGLEGNAAYYKVKPSHRLIGRRGLRGPARAARRRDGPDAPRAHVQRRIARSISRFISRSLIARRLSPTSLPLASAISTFACEPLKYMRVGTSVSPRSRVLPIRRSISRLCISSLRGRSGSWFSVVAGGYGAMWTL